VGYLFVDRILEVGRAASGSVTSGPPALRARGLKAVSRSDPFLRRATDGKFSLPPCFAGEALGQLAAWLAMSATGFSRRPVAGLTAEVEVHGAAALGEILHLEVEIESLEDDAVHYHGTASAGGRPVLVLRHSVGPLLPMERFDDPREVERRFHQLLLPLEKGDPAATDLTLETDSGGEPPLPERLEEPLAHPAIDAIVERDSERILAVTCVSRNAPYLADHFPRDPVLPATLLFDGQAALAASLASQGLEGREPLRVSRLSDLKMRDFIRPGSRLLSEVRIRDRRPGRVSVQLTGRVGSRVVSSGVVELTGSAPAGSLSPAAFRKESE
jgi:3-hydroxymyristoyl/3-hydroxydecanoyl-(acyl carrier protein) dehydratase